MTHARGHTLDLIITRERERWVSQKCPLLDCVIQMKSYQMITVLLRANLICGAQVRSKKKEFFGHSVTSTLLILGMICGRLFSGENSDELLSIYNMNIKDIVDMHTPEQENIITLRPHAPCYNGHIRKMRREQRCCERKYRKSKLERFTLISVKLSKSSL